MKKQNYCQINYYSFKKIYPNYIHNKQNFCSLEPFKALYFLDISLTLVYKSFGIFTSFVIPKLKRNLLGYRNHEF